MAKITIRQQNTNSVIEDVARSEIALESNAVYALPLEQWRTWDAMATNLPGTPATDDLGLVTGTLGTDFPSLQTGDLKTAGATTRYAACTVTLPPEYEAGSTIKIRASAGMVTTISDGTATIDFECYPSDEDATASADIVSTSAASINSLTFANKDFTVTGTNRNPGDQFQIRVAIAVTDTASGTAVIGCAAKVSLLLSVRG